MDNSQYATIISEATKHVKAILIAEHPGVEEVLAQVAKFLTMLDRQRRKYAPKPDTAKNGAARKGKDSE